MQNNCGSSSNEQPHGATAPNTMQFPPPPLMEPELGAWTEYAGTSAAQPPTTLPDATMSTADAGTAVQNERANTQAQTYPTSAAQHTWRTLDEAAPAYGAAPMDGATPAYGAAPMDGATPVYGAAPTDGTAPVDGATPGDVLPPILSPLFSSPAATEPIPNVTEHHAIASQNVPTASTAGVPGTLWEPEHSAQRNERHAAPAALPGRLDSEGTGIGMHATSSIQQSEAAPQAQQGQADAQGFLQLAGNASHAPESTRDGEPGPSIPENIVFARVDLRRCRGASTAGAANSGAEIDSTVDMVRALASPETCPLVNQSLHGDATTPATAAGDRDGEQANRSDIRSDSHSSDHLDPRAALRRALLHRRSAFLERAIRQIAGGSAPGAASAGLGAHGLNSGQPVFTTFSNADALARGNFQNAPAGPTTAEDIQQRRAAPESEPNARAETLAPHATSPGAEQLNGNADSHQPRASASTVGERNAAAAASRERRIGQLRRLLALATEVNRTPEGAIRVAVRQVPDQRPRPRMSQAQQAGASNGEGSTLAAALATSPHSAPTPAPAPSIDLSGIVAPVPGTPAQNLALSPEPVAIPTENPSVVVEDFLNAEPEVIQLEAGPEAQPQAVTRRAGPVGSNEARPTKRSRVAGSADKAVSAGSDGPSVAEQNTCLICLERWTKEGDHRLVVLECGHLLGQSCAKKWLTSKKYCPTCRKKATIRTCRMVYGAPSELCVLDEHEKHTLMKAIETEKKAKKALEKQCQAIKQERDKLERDYKALSQQKHRSLVGSGVRLGARAANGASSSAVDRSRGARDVTATRGALALTTETSTSQPSIAQFFPGMEAHTLHLTGASSTADYPEVTLGVAGPVHPTTMALAASEHRQPFVRTRPSQPPLRMRYPTRCGGSALDFDEAGSAVFAESGGSPLRYRLVRRPLTSSVSVTSSGWLSERPFTHLSINNTADSTRPYAGYMVATATDRSVRVYNSEFQEAVSYTLTHVPVSCSWTPAHPNYIVAGTTVGKVYAFDIRSTSREPLWDVTVKPEARSANTTGPRAVHSLCHLDDIPSVPAGSLLAASPSCVGVLSVGSTTGGLSFEEVSGYQGSCAGASTHSSLISLCSKQGSSSRIDVFDSVRRLPAVVDLEAAYDVELAEDVLGSSVRGRLTFGGGPVARAQLDGLTNVQRPHFGSTVVRSRSGAVTVACGNDALGGDMLLWQRPASGAWSAASHIALPATGRVRCLKGLVPPAVTNRGPLVGALYDDCFVLHELAG